MKVLVLTNKEYKEFVMGVVGKDVTVYYGDEPFRFDLGGWYYDVGISFMYTHKVPAREVNTHTWFNFHPGPLPEYRGRNLCYHAIMNGDTKFGASLHYMDENFDTGGIIDVWHFDIEPGATAYDVSRWAIETAKAMFDAYFPQILENTEFEVVPNVDGTYYKKEPIDDTLWTSKNISMEYLERQIRAIYFPPHYPKIEIGGVTYKIVRDE